MSVYYVNVNVGLLCQCQVIMSMQMLQAPTDGHKLAKTPQGGSTTHKFVELRELGRLGCYLPQ